METGGLGACKEIGGKRGEAKKKGGVQNDKAQGVLPKKRAGKPSPEKWGKSVRRNLSADKKKAGGVSAVTAEGDIQQTIGSLLMTSKKTNGKRRAMFKMR